MKTRVLFTINSWALLTRGQHLWGHQSCLSMAPTSVRSPGGSLEPQGNKLLMSLNEIKKWLELVFPLRPHIV